MKKFKFSLQQVLDVKVHQKMQVSRELVDLEKRKNAIESSIQKLARQWQREKAALQRNMKELVSAEYRMRLAYLQHLDHQIDFERRKLVSLSAKIGAVRHKLMQYAREEQALSLLSEKKQETYRKTLRKKEQDATDELSSQRIVHRMLERAVRKKHIN